MANDHIYEVSLVDKTKNCSTCGNYRCKDAYPCAPMREEVRRCVNNHLRNWVPIIEKEKKDDQT